MLLKSQHTRRIARRKEPFVGVVHMETNMSSLSTNTSLLILQRISEYVSSIIVCCLTYLCLDSGGHASTSAATWTGSTAASSMVITSHPPSTIEATSDSATSTLSAVVAHYSTIQNVSPLVLSVGPTNIFSSLYVVSLGDFVSILISSGHRPALLPQR